jgi:uncharacterized glyoxalase superfamily protein PhnB
MGGGADENGVESVAAGSGSGIGKNPRGGSEEQAMIENRSVPVDTVLPHLYYDDVAEAVAWLSRVFGFAEHYRYGQPDGAQMHLGKAWIMLARIRPDRTSPRNSGKGAQSLTIFVEDVDGHYGRAKAAGAKIVEELHETVYGERQYGAQDYDGNHWLFSCHARDVSPEEWGATIAQKAP